MGINDYSASNLTAPKPTADAGPLPKGQRDYWPSLEGAVNDVEDMREMLVGRFGFQDADVRLLKDQEATREAILRAVREHLVEPAREGDVVVFHYSGHGSQVRNSKSPERDQLDESIVPADSVRGALDVRDKELRGLFNEVLAKGARPVVVLDSCHSGSGARGLPDGSTPRLLEPDLRDVADGKDYGPPIEQGGALVLAASQDYEPALEGSDESGRRHGAFTLALLRALRAATPGESSRNVFARARGWLGATGRFQRPVLEGLPERLAEPLFGAPSDDQGGAVVVVDGVEDDGQVRLLGGWVDGLAPGSELRRLDTDAGPRLRVTELDGLRRSRAEVLANGADPAVSRGELFEIVSWVADLQPLRVWVPRAETTDAARRLAKGLAAGTRDGQADWVEDPTETTPSHVVRWSGGGFELLGPGVPPADLGTEPSADAVLGRLPDGARLFVQLPAPAALPEGLEIGPGSRHSAIEVVDDPGQATYVLTGRLHDPLGNPALEYAWIRPGSLHGDRGSVHLPERSAWIALASTESKELGETSRRLRDKVLRLFKVFAWNRLESSLEARDAFPYRLAIAEADGTLVDDERLLSGRNYSLVLRTEDGAPIDAHRVENRYIYVFAIDSAGASNLLYPRIYLSSENNYPGSSAKDGWAPGRIDLGKESRFDIVEPFGYDTFFLLTSGEPVSDPGLVFQYEGVRGQEPPRRSALATLLAEVGSTKRGTRAVATPSSWSIEKKTYQTIRAGD